MPQWVQLEWSVPVTATRAVVTTTAGFELRDYDLQAWVGTPQTGGWVTLAAVNANANVVNVHAFPQVTTARMRILGRSGSAAQPGYVRVNEIQVY
jgi:hypothetical protein